ncbi:MAG: SpoIIE family protein phosphatase, partial [candidate division Zixibacteria bacterium]|nr:SpoIIE family protein phosphatase [candidate division Zixibacteria bacterium]
GWVENETAFAPGDSVVVYSDGVTEAECAERDELFGEDRLEKLLEKDKALSPRELVGSVMEQVNSFAAGTPRSDDVTLLVVKRTAGC